MPIFEYKALNNRGSQTTGILDADSIREARDKLRNQKLFVTTIKEIKEETRRAKKSFMPAILQGKRLEEMSMVTRQLATLLNAGIPLAQSLQALIEQVQNARLQTTFRDIKEQIMQGASLAEALSVHPLYFSQLYVNMVKAGEASGTLDSVLTRLADYIQAQNRLKAKITTALTYPIVLILIGTIVVIFLMVKVVPRITKLLDAQEQVLPPITKLMISISSFFQNTWFVIPIVILGFFALWKAWVSTNKGRRTWDRMMLKIPIMGDLFRKVSVSRFAITFSTLLKSGIPALDALKIVGSVVKNKILQDTLEEVHEKIMEGSDISTPIKKSGVFPPVVGYMMAVGEQSGRLEELLDRISSAYDEEVDIATQKFTAMLEPILIVCMAGVVGLIVASIMLPLLQLSRGMGQQA